MVMKKCKICGKEFDARGSMVTCSSECRKINQRELQREWHNKNPEYKKEYRLNNRDKILKKEKEYYINNRDKILKQQKEYRLNNRDKILKKEKEYYINNRDKILKRKKEYYVNNRDKILKRRKEYYVNNYDKILKNGYKTKKRKIEYLISEFDGDIDVIKKYCPSKWLIRELEMLINYNVSYFNGMIAKIESTPVCEVTGSNKNLVIHHLESYNIHPELGADPNNMVRVTEDIHKEFHSIYGYGNNTREQWNKFILR